MKATSIALSSIPTGTTRSSDSQNQAPKTRLRAALGHRWLNKPSVLLGHGQMLWGQCPQFPAHDGEKGASRGKKR